MWFMNFLRLIKLTLNMRNHMKTSRCNLTAPIFKKFPGAIPSDPLELHAKHAECALHTDLLANRDAALVHSYYV